MDRINLKYSKMKLRNWATYKFRLFAATKCYFRDHKPDNERKIKLELNVSNGVIIVAVFVSYSTDECLCLLLYFCVCVCACVWASVNVLDCH